jgi:hypothetical protein
MTFSASLVPGRPPEVGLSETLAKTLRTPTTKGGMRRSLRTDPSGPQMGLCPVQRLSPTTPPISRPRASPAPVRTSSVGDVARSHRAIAIAMPARGSSRQARRKAHGPRRGPFPTAIERKPGETGRARHAQNDGKALQTSQTQKRPHTTENRGALGSSPGLPRNAKAKQEPAVPGARRFPVVQSARLMALASPAYPGVGLPRDPRLATGGEHSRFRPGRGKTGGWYSRIPSFRRSLPRPQTTWE